MDGIAAVVDVEGGNEDPDEEGGRGERDADTTSLPIRFTATIVMKREEAEEEEAPGLLFP